MALLASFFNGDCFHAYNFVRELVLKDIKNPRLWNLFNLVKLPKNIICQLPFENMKVIFFFLQGYNQS